MRVDFDPNEVWYGAGKVPFPKQQQFLFDPHAPDGCAFYQGWLGGRGSGKSVGLGRKAFLLSLLNPGVEGDPNPVMGALMGRSMTEIQLKLLPHFDAAMDDFRRVTGITWRRTYNTDLQLMTFANGSGMYLLSYNDAATLSRMARGLTLGWIVTDEIMWGSAVSSNDVVRTAVACLRDPRAPHKCFVWGSSPNGLRGIAKKHHVAYGSANWYLVHTKARDNPHLRDEDIARISEGLSKAEQQQEIEGICLQPGNVVFHEYAEERHLVTWTPSSACRNVIGIDWGKGHAYICAIQVTEDGRWFVWREEKVTDTTRMRFRDVVKRFVDQVEDETGRPIFLMACDRAVKSERNWLFNCYDDQVEAGVQYLNKRKSMAIDWGLNCISGMLDPVAGEPRLFLSASLSASIEDASMGIRGAFTEYVNVQFRAPDGEMITIDEPSKKTNADHPMDALRYAICCSVNEPMLHGGHKLPVFLDESSPVDEDEEKFETRGQGRR